MSFIIISRNPRVNRLVIVTADEDEDNVPAEFNSEDEAIDAAHNTTICRAWGYHVVEVP